MIDREKFFGMGIIKTLNGIFLVVILFVISSPTAVQAVMNDYCVTPPFISQNIAPSVLVVLDNSLSMCEQAYPGSYNPDQFESELYYGYFDGSKNYRYDDVKWIETTETMESGTTANPIANGSFLNWATMRKVEVAKKILVGGKAVPRSPEPDETVRLVGEASCPDGWDVFEKDFDTSGSGFIHPFDDGKYRFTRSGQNLTIRLAKSFDVYPNEDISIPAGWTAYPEDPESDAYTRVADVDNSDYIQNINTTDPIIMGYDYPQENPLDDAIGAITVTVNVVAKKTAEGAARKIKGVLNINDGINDVNYESSGSSSLSTFYDTYSFTWTNNPATSVPWTWENIKSSVTGSEGTFKGFGIQAERGYTSSYPQITQIYLRISVDASTDPSYSFVTEVDTKGAKAVGIIDNLNDSARFGLAYFANSNDGGGVDSNAYVNFGSSTNMNNSIEDMVPSTRTPLGETLYEMIRYFRQETPYYTHNSPADYQTGINYDPYWYIFSSKKAQYVPCSKAFILLLTDGESTYDENVPGSDSGGDCSLTNIKGCCPNEYRFAGTQVGTTYPDYGTDYMIDAAFWGRTADARPGSCTTVPTSWQQCLPDPHGKSQNIILYPVYMFGEESKLLKDAAIVGGFKDLNGNNLPDCASIPAECYKDSNEDRIISVTEGYCSNDSTRACTSDTSADDCTAPGTCVVDDPVTYFEGDDGYALEKKIREAIADILKRVTSGTAASVLASGEGSGANLLQATYYPERQFEDNSINWIGSMQNLWYYVDPYYANSSIRQEGGTTKDFILDLRADGSSETGKDYVTQLYFDTSEQKAKAKLFSDSDGDGGAESELIDSPIDFEKVGNLWNAGPLLWSRNLSSSPRTIKTWIDRDNDGDVDSDEFIGFSVASYNDPANKGILQTLLQAADDDAAKKTISYIHGYDRFCTNTSTPCVDDSPCLPATCSDAPFRSRTVSFDFNGDGDISDPEDKPKVWKLGDIISSTPKISSWIKLNGYDDTYQDTSYSQFVNDTVYINRGMVFVGANDGMLHAFKLGKLELKWTGQNEEFQMARLTGSDLGKEIWAYVPKNALPYLNYMQDPDYCHVYSVDLSPFIFDASIGKPAECSAGTDYWDCAKTRDSWRTILIGGMQYGGACKETAVAQGVTVPISGQGYSSYFALDITDAYNPKLLWEFKHTDLGFTTSGPAVVRISARNSSVGGSTADVTKNGKWFVIFGSGPTGSIEPSNHQFLGNSDQNLKLFVLDLKTGSLAATVDTGIANAFSGSLLNSTHDSDKDYQDDVIYIPYVRKCVSGDSSETCDSSAEKWNNGGVLRLLTNEDLPEELSTNTALNPANWKVSKVMDDAGPVTASVARLQNITTGNLWMYFGSGRFYYKLSDTTGTTIDDSSHVRYLYGLKDPCFSNGAFRAECLDGSVPLSYTVSDLVDVTTSEESTDEQGWRIKLDGCLTLDGAAVACSEATAYYKPERVITNPASSPKGFVFFTTLTPYDDICSSGGNTAIWAVKYDTGGALGSLLQGKALIQVSTGAIEQVDMATAFTEKGGRKTVSMDGIPPIGDGVSIMLPPNPVRRIIHIKER